MADSAAGRCERLGLAGASPLNEVGCTISLDDGFKAVSSVDRLSSLDPFLTFEAPKLTLDRPSAQADRIAQEDWR
jgi:hypothetical protein